MNIKPHPSINWTSLKYYIPPEGPLLTLDVQGSIQILFCRYVEIKKLDNPQFKALFQYTWYKNYVVNDTENGFIPKHLYNIHPYEIEYWAEIYDTAIRV